jgi:hypothetical protein
MLFRDVHFIKYNMHGTLPVPNRVRTIIGYNSVTPGRVVTGGGRDRGGRDSDRSR